ncbi:NERD domain-containing protein, partial [Enterobacter hormaechei]|nr:NERD domain-containing protein [Enterobacter hormaechei]
VNIRTMANCESFFDKPIFELVKAWLRNLGLVAFNQIKTKYDGEGNPVVGSFEWDMTAPSYVSPLAEYVGGKLMPGFVACDFSLGFNRDEITTAAAETFIRKVQMTKSSRASQRIMFVIFARRFGKIAFNKLRSEGVLAVTIANAFGNKVDESLTRLSRVVQGSLSIEKHPDELLQMVKDLESVSGENGNLRGYVFELFVSSQISNFYGLGNIYINREYKINGKHAEADVVLESSDDIYII